MTRGMRWQIGTLRAAGLSVSQIANRLAVSKRFVYRHWNTKGAAA